MFDFNGAFGAYAFHEEEIERAVSAFVEAYESGADINDPETANAICWNVGLNPSNFSNSEIQRMNREIEDRIN